jgi:hypothetical protein
MNGLERYEKKLKSGFHIIESDEIIMLYQMGYMLNHLAVCLEAL